MHEHINQIRTLLQLEGQGLFDFVDRIKECSKTKWGMGPSSCSSLSGLNPDAVITAPTIVGKWFVWNLRSRRLSMAHPLLDGLLGLLGFAPALTPWTDL